MVTDEDRREAAERLRACESHVDAAGWFWLNDALGGAHLVASSEERLRRGTALLADLIDPCDMLYVTYSRSTCGPDGMAYMVKVRHRARGLERDFYAVDLKKLLEVLDEMDITVKCAGPDVPRDYVENWANEVREALGANYG